MLFALVHPVLLVFLVVAFVLAVLVHGVATAVAARALGDRAPRAYAQDRPDPRVHLDPFGSVAAAIAGVGWSRPVELTEGVRRPPARWAVALLAGPVATLALGCGVLLASGLLGLTAPPLQPSLVLQGDVGVLGLPLAQEALLAVGTVSLAVGLLSLVPLPPLVGGRLLLAYAPRTRGWERARYYLQEQNIGVGVLLALLLLPLVGRRPLLLVLIDLVGAPILRVLTGTP